MGMQYLLTWAWPAHWRWDQMFRMGEEGEQEEEEESCYDEPPKQKDELHEWWLQFRQRTEYPLYCIILSSDSDSEVVRLIQDHRPELAMLSGPECCFVYFRNMDRAKRFEPHQYSEHSRWAYPLARLLGIDFGNIPCILFFEQLDSGEYVLVSLKGKTTSEIMALLRDVFQTLQGSDRSRPLSTVRKFNVSQNVTIARRSITRNVATLGSQVISELLKALVKLS